MDCSLCSTVSTAEQWICPAVFSPHRPNIRSVNANQWTKWSMKTFSWPCLYIEVYIRDIHIYIIYIFCFYIVQSDHVTANRLCATFCTSRTFHEGMASCHAHLYCLFRHRVIVTVREVSSQMWESIISKCEFFDGFSEREFNCANYVSIGTRFLLLPGQFIKQEKQERSVFKDWKQFTIMTYDSVPTKYEEVRFYCRQLRARGVLSLSTNVPLRTRRVLSP